MIVEQNENQPQTMALRPRLAGRQVRGEDPSGYFVPAARDQAQWQMQASWCEIIWPKDRGWSCAAYSGSDDTWQIHQRKTGDR